MAREISVHDNLHGMSECLSDSRSVRKTYAFVRAIVDIRKAGCGNPLAFVLQGG